MTQLEDQEYRRAIALKVKNDYGLKLAEDDISLCIIEMETKKLSIFHGQIYPNKRSRKIGKGYDDREDFISWDPTIDGARAIAHRHGLCGIDQPEFEVEGILPVQVSVTVYRRGPRGERYPFVGNVRYEEFVQKVKYDGKWHPNRMWKQSPFNQLAKCAESQALRKGFQEIGEDDPFLVELDETPVETVNVDYSDVPISSMPPGAVEVTEVRPPDVPLYKAGEMFNDQKIIEYGCDNEGVQHLGLANGTKVRVLKNGMVDIQLPSESGAPTVGPPIEIPSESEPPQEAPQEPQEKTLESMREYALPYLKRWCEEKNQGVKMSYKAAYEKLLGVVTDSIAMNVNDYEALISQLKDELGEKSA